MTGKIYVKCVKERKIKAMQQSLKPVPSEKVKV